MACLRVKSVSNLFPHKHKELTNQRKDSKTAISAVMLPYLSKNKAFFVGRSLIIYMKPKP